MANIPKRCAHRGSSAESISKRAFFIDEKCQIFVKALLIVSAVFSMMSGRLRNEDCLYSTDAHAFGSHRSTFCAHNVVACVRWWVTRGLHGDAGKDATSEIAILPRRSRVIDFQSSFFEGQWPKFAYTCSLCGKKKKHLEPCFKGGTSQELSVGGAS